MLCGRRGGRVRVGSPGHPHSESMRTELTAGTGRGARSGHFLSPDKNFDPRRFSSVMDELLAKMKRVDSPERKQPPGRLRR